MQTQLIVHAINAAIAVAAKSLAVIMSSKPGNYDVQLGLLLGNQIKSVFDQRFVSISSAAPTIIGPMKLRFYPCAISKNRNVIVDFGYALVRNSKPSSHHIITVAAARVAEK